VRFDAPIKTKCQTLDNWYRNSDFNIYNKPIECIWSDLNGNEGNMIFGASEILQNTHLIYLECFDEELYESMKKKIDT